MHDKMTRMAKNKDTVGAPFTVRLAPDQSDRMSQWVMETGQPASLVVRAAIGLLFATIDGMPFEAKVRFVADVGMSTLPDVSRLARSVGETWQREQQKTEEPKRGRKSG